MNNWTEFDELLSSKGVDYIRLRDNLVNAKGDLSEKISSQKTEGQWQRKVLAEALEAWRSPEKKAVFDAILKELDSVNYERERKKVTGIQKVWEDFEWRAKGEYRPIILPLCREVVFKLADDWPEWKVIAFFRMLTVVPDNDSVPLLLSFIVNTKNSNLRSFAADALANQPIEAVQAALKSQRDKASPTSDQVELILKEVESSLSAIK